MAISASGALSPWYSTSSIEPLAPAELQDARHGDLLARVVADVDSLQNLYLRGLGPPLVAIAAGAGSVAIAAAVLPPAAAVLGGRPALRTGRHP